jgi:ketosteroid isomerase-like protein
MLEPEESMERKRDRSDGDAIIEANQAFYRAFAAGDFGALEQLIAEGDVATAHPWRPAAHGRAEVLEGWAAIIEAGPPAIRCLAPRIAQLGDGGDVAIVTCIEEVGADPCVATNVFVRQAGAWRLAHHHGAPLAPAFLPEGPAGTVH